MKTNESLLIAIADQSVIVRSGVLTTLKRLPKLNTHAVELANMADLEDCFMTQPVDILIVNPYFESYFDIDKFRESCIVKSELKENRKVKIIALATTLIDPSTLNNFDAKIGLFDSLSDIGETIYDLSRREDEDDDQETLSEREKEVVVCVVKGMTNKEIAEHLFLSIHTINTHRKNISKKLQIHSASGLTIYAIVNKLVDINEIKAD